MHFKLGRALVAGVLVACVGTDAQAGDLHRRAPADFPEVLLAAFERHAAGTGAVVPLGGLEFQAASAGSAPWFQAVLEARASVASAADGEVAILIRNDDGALVVFTDRDGHGAWTGTRLTDATDPPPGGDGRIWYDPKDGRLHVAYPSQAGLGLAVREADGTWRKHNLTTTLAGGASPIVASLTYFLSPNLARDFAGNLVEDGQGNPIYPIPPKDRDNVHLAGFNPAGELVLYFQRRETDEAPTRWAYANLSRDFLAPAGQEAPDCATDPVGYVTPWNGRNIACLRDNGDLVAVWTAPDRNGAWATTNLSRGQHTPPLHGGLSAYVNWGINLTGVLADGSLGVTWWSAEYEADQRARGRDDLWAFTDLTRLAGGPRVQADGVTGYTMPNWPGNNIVARNEADELVVYWWAPGNREAFGKEWLVDNLSRRLDLAEPTVGAIAATAGTDGAVSIVGVTGAGDVVRFLWSVADDWAFQNVTAAATVAGTGAITGVVLGTTTVLVLNREGAIVGRADTAGATPEVDLNGDGIAEAFRFRADGLPVGEELAIFLIHDGDINVLLSPSDATPEGYSTRFTLRWGAEVDLGVVDLRFFAGFPQLVPAAHPAVAAGPLNLHIPPGIGTPATEGLAVEELTERGLDALEQGWILGARTYFLAATDRLGNSTSPEADTIHFFTALSRIGGFGLDLTSDGNPSPLERPGDVLDRFGVRDNLFRANPELLHLPETLPEDSPRGKELRDFLYDRARPELIAAIHDLDLVSSDFQRTWWNPRYEQRGADSDYGDVLFLRGAAKLALAVIAAQRAYDLDADLDAVRRSNRDDDPFNDVTVESFLNDDHDFLRVEDAAKLLEAKDALLNAGLDDLSRAVDQIVAEAATDPDQSDDLVAFEPGADIDPQRAKAEIADFKAAIDSGPVLVHDNDAREGDEYFLDLAPVFAGQIDRQELPAFDGNDAGAFSDPTLGGVSSDSNPANAIPDVLDWSGWNRDSD